MSKVSHRDFFTILLGDDFKITIVVGEIYTVATFELNCSSNEGLAVAINDATFDDFSRWVVLLRSLCDGQRGQGLSRACRQARACQQGA